MTATRNAFVVVGTLWVVLFSSFVGMADAFIQSLKMKDGEITGLGETILTETSPKVNRRLEEEPQMPVLASKYDISVPDVFYCDTSEFMFRFDLSDFVTNDMMYFNLSRGDECEFDIWDNSYLTPSVYYDAAPKGNGTWVRQVLLVLEPDLLFIAGSPIWTVSQDGASGTLSFCSKITLLTEDLTTIVNFRNIVYEQTTVLTTEVRRLDTKTGNEIDYYEKEERRRLMLDCSSGYDFLFENWWQSGIDENFVPQVIDPVENVTYVEETQAPSGNQTSNTTGGFGGIIIAPESMVSMGGSGTPQNVSFTTNVEVFECDSNNSPYTKQTAYEQGELYRICIKPDPEAISLGLYMRRIDNLFYSRQDVPGLVQYAVEGGITDFYGMSEVFCDRGSDVCRVETIIRSEFFATPGMVNVVGIASLQFGNSPSRRDLEISFSNGRDLQREIPQDRGQFSVLFPVGTFGQTLAQQTKSSEVSMLQYILLIVLSFTYLALVIYLCWIRSTRKIQAMAEEERMNKLVRKLSKRSMERSDSKKSLDKSDSKRRLERGDSKKSLDKSESKRRLERGGSEESLGKSESRKSLDRSDSKKKKKKKKKRDHSTEKSVLSERSHSSHSRMSSVRFADEEKCDSTAEESHIQDHSCGIDDGVDQNFLSDREEDDYSLPTKRIDNFC